MSVPNAIISDEDLARLLPTCQRCRRLRRKCDTQLPACRLCQKGKAECTFFDHALQQTLPRSYVHSLMTRLGRLKSVQAAVGETREEMLPLDSPRVQRRSTVTELDPAIQNLGRNSTEISFDKHFTVKNANPTCWQFFGSSSAYALAVEVLVHARTKFGPVTNPEHYTGGEFALNRRVKETAQVYTDTQPPVRSDVELLVAFYMATTNVLMAYIDVETVAQDIEAYFTYQGRHARSLTGAEAHQYFRLSMICATAAANKSRHSSKYHAESMQYYADALQCVEEVTSDVSADALVALLLLINFSCYYPRMGDVWKLLDFACRLSIELGYHTEPSPPDPYETEASRTRRRYIFWGLYCIERTVGQHLGRPSDLTEDIITVEYPAVLNNLTLSSDPSEFQHVLSSHYYRLCYLRSEIFRDHYMPARAPDFPRPWYTHKLESVLSWQQELRYLDDVLGMGSMTCEVGFESTVCFLFQPLLLRGLVATKDASPSILGECCPKSIPQESYRSAVGIIRFYEEVFRAPEHTPYGMYPVTMVSAHYIYQGVMTVLACCLLALDGRIPFSSYMPQPDHVFGSQHQESTDNIDFSSIHEINESCLLVLSKVAERFPGMLGMLDIYKNVSDKVLPAMMKMELG